MFVRASRPSPRQARPRRRRRPRIRAASPSSTTSRSLSKFRTAAGHPKAQPAQPCSMAEFGPGLLALAGYCVTHENNMEARVDSNEWCWARSCPPAPQLDAPSRLQPAQRPARPSASSGRRASCSLLLMRMCRAVPRGFPKQDEDVSRVCRRGARLRTPLSQAGLPRRPRARRRGRGRGPCMVVGAAGDGGGADSSSRLVKEAATCGVVTARRVLRTRGMPTGSRAYPPLWLALHDERYINAGNATA